MEPRIYTNADLRKLPAMSVFASRASAELERQRSAVKLHQSREQLRVLLQRIDERDRIL